MKTAMQDLIEKLNYSIQNSKGDYQMNFAWVKSHCIMLLEKEKMQIIDAYDEGIINGESNEDGNGEMFYNLFYNQNN